MTDRERAQDWLLRFAASLDAGEDTAPLFTPDCYWRDLLAMTFDLVTVEGRRPVATMLADRREIAAPAGWRLTSEAARDEDDLIEAWFAFDTALGPATGALRLRGGLAHHVYTTLTDIAGHEEPVGRNRPRGVTPGATRDRRTWADTRRAETAGMGDTDQPYALIVGGGQGGLGLSARLRALAVPHLVIEANARAGDAWRNRYRSLVLHDPVWYDHMPYLPFPPTWPVFTPKDKMGDWLEAYASVMEVPLWTSSTVDGAVRDGDGWRVEVTRGGAPVVLTPRHLIFATGAYGPPREIDFAGAETFGGTLIHSRDYRGGADWAGKRAVVIGSASSAHDVAVDLWEAGAAVTMIQRSPTTVVRSGTLMDVGFAIYSEAAVEAGIGTDRADHMAASVPFGAMATRQRRLYAGIRERDADFYRRLTDAGFRIDFGEDESGQMMKALRTGTGFYIDVGGSDLIARGEIGVVQGGVARIVPDGVETTGGERVAADLIVACVGYRSMNETVARVVDRETADRVGPCWGIGSGVRGDPGPWLGEVRNLWKPTAEPGLWFHGGNLAMSRFYSRVLALQIKARMEGLDPPVWRTPA